METSAKKHLAIEALERRDYLSADIVDSTQESLNSTPDVDQWPDDWQTNEIEAKWTTDQTTLHELAALFPTDEAIQEIDGTSYLVDIRWKGIPRRFTDVYCDTDDGALADESHTLRYRQRHEWNEEGTPPAFSDTVADLMHYTEWRRSWAKVQYKSSPSRLGPVWFREEFGAAKLDRDQVAAAVAGEQLAEVSVRDDPVLAVQLDHGNIDWHQVSTSLKNVAFRYRVQLEDPLSGDELLELSLDKVHSCTRDESGAFTGCRVFYEVEVESLMATEANIQGLFGLSNWLEGNYPNLVPSTQSKGSVEFSERGADNVAQCSGDRKNSAILGDCDNTTLLAALESNPSDNLGMAKADEKITTSPSNRQLVPSAITADEVERAASVDARDANLARAAVDSVATSANWNRNVDFDRDDQVTSLNVDFLDDNYMWRRVVPAVSVATEPRRVPRAPQPTGQDDNTVSTPAVMDSGSPAVRNSLDRFIIASISGDKRQDNQVFHRPRPQEPHSFAARWQHRESYRPLRATEEQLTDEAFSVAVPEAVANASAYSRRYFKTQDSLNGGLACLSLHVSDFVGLREEKKA